VNNNPAGVGVIVSAAVKAVLIALSSLGAVPLNDDAIASVTLAVAAIVDVLLYFGLVKPGVNRLQEQAATEAVAGSAAAHRPTNRANGPDIP
jgi:hypothetical protein